jgi:DnaK suppressor protein
MAAKKKGTASKRTTAAKKTRAAAKKAASKKTTAKPAAAKKAPAKKKVAKKPALKKKATTKKVATSTTKRKAGAGKKPTSKKSATGKTTGKKAVTASTTSGKKATTKKAVAKKSAAKKAPTKKAPAKKAAAKKAPARKAAAKKGAKGNVERVRRFGIQGPLHGFEPYKPKAKEEYMSDRMLAHFSSILVAWKQELMEEVDRTVGHMKNEAANFPDPNDRATQESEFSLELRTRDRERKLLRKIDSALQRIEDGDYGYCAETGEEIGLKRLEARPVATLSVEAQERRELAEKQYRDWDDR